MSYLKNNGIFVIEEEPEGICEYCGKEAETRPYGKKGARICFECGMANEKETKANFEFKTTLYKNN